MTRNLAVHEYEYDEHHNIIRAVSAENSKYTFDYDDYGNALESRVANHGNDQEYIRTKAEYTDNGNHIRKVTDALGNSVTYDYYSNGIVKSVTDALGEKATYSYDAMNCLKTVSQAVTLNGATQNAQVGYTYTNDRLTQIAHNGFNYEMTYDAFGKRTATKVAGTTLASHAYAGNNGLLTSTTYGNDTKLSYMYDEFDRVIKVTMTKDSVTTTLYEYVYDKQGNVAKVMDKANNVTYRHYYDLTDRLVMTSDSLGNSYTYTYTYDANDNLTKLTTISATGTLTSEYSYDGDNRETKTKAKVKELTTAYDGLGRVASKTWDTTAAFATTYAYKKGVEGSKSSQLASISNDGSVISYNYDANGNITSMTDSAGTTTDHYNELNWLVREDNPRYEIVNGTNVAKTVVYIYDIGGNIKKKEIYPFTAATAAPTGTPETVNYTYDSVWKDKMTAFGNKTITYDAIGNPTKYGDWNMAWTQGRRLASMSTSAGDSLTFAYNEAGIRTKKVDNKDGLTYQYQLAGSKVVGERVTNTASGSLVYANQYMYDSAGNIVSMVYTAAGQGAVEYYYVKNGQGDILGLIDVAGNVVVNYSYDSWGKLLSVTGNTTLGNRNPFRYRGYYYDAETGLYYLKSRYYDSGVGKFVNADDVSYLGLDGTLISYNLYAYCKNNPFLFKDSSGRFGLLAIAGIIATSGILGGILGAFSAAATGGNVIEGAIEGCITGMIGSACGLLISNPITAVAAAAISSFTVDVATQATVQHIETQTVDMTEIDYGRSVKTAVQTGLGTAIPAFGNANGALDAVATALMWGEASTLIVSADVIITNVTFSEKTSSKTLTSGMGRPLVGFRIMSLY